MVQLLQTSQKSTDISAQEQQSAFDWIDPPSDEKAPHPLWRDEIPPTPEPKAKKPLSDLLKTDLAKNYLHKIRTLGGFYGIGDMAVPHPITAIYAAADAERKRLCSELGEIERQMSRLLFRETNRLSQAGVGENTIYEIKEVIRQSQDFERSEALRRDLDHQFRYEIECPVTTRNLSQEAYHIYLHLMQEEAFAAQGKAYAFTLTNNFDNRTQLLKDLREAGFLIDWVVGCTLRYPKSKAKCSDDPSITPAPGLGYVKPTKKRKQKRKACRKAKADLEGKQTKKKKPRAKPKPRRNPWGRKARTQHQDNEPEPHARPHLHGLAIKTDRVKGKPINALREILGKTTFVEPIRPSDPERTAKKKRGRTAALAQGFVGYAIYMAKNFDEFCPNKHIKKQGIRRSAQKLTKTEKSLLHPKKTRGELEAWNTEKELVRARIGAPKEGKQWWIMQHWEEITEATKAPKYDYPAKVILRDGFEYTITPQWDMEFQTLGVRSVACAFERDLVWQEKVADSHRLDRPPGSKPVYETLGGECELDIILYLTRNRRVIQAHESPECPVYDYRAIGGRIRPHPDRLLPRNVA